MRILIVGASGLIGSALVQQLAHRHRLVLGVREPGMASQPFDAERVQIDYTAPDRERWSAAMIGIDAVVNAAGIFREKGNQSFDAIHVKGPQTLFDAAVDAGVARIVQISALGARADAPAAFLATKAQADAHLLRLPVQATVVQPSLVFAPDGASTRWFALLAALPLTPLPGGGTQRIQPVHLDDLCAAIERLLDVPAPPQRLAAVGPEPLPLRAYLGVFKRALGVGGPFLSVPLPLAQAGSRLLARFTRAPVGEDALRMLGEGNTADAAPFERVLGRPPRAPSRFIDASARQGMRTQAVLGWTVPLLRWTTAVLWIATGLLSAFVFPVRESLELLARTGLLGAAATVALYGAAAFDLALGLALFLRAPVRRWAYCLQIALMLGYTVLITAFLPEYWAHPYGPVLKNLPLLAATALLLALDGRHAQTRPDA
jgi:uncharacterized protein YbjT (DUF2867 family)